MIETKTFQGERYLKNSKDYFEGWYFKNCINDFSISFIPGISISNKKKVAFVQILDNLNSYYIPYKIEEFEYSSEPFHLKVGKNYFSDEKVIIDISEADSLKIPQSLSCQSNTQKKVRVIEIPKINAEIHYRNSRDIIRTKVNPTIMGPFSYIPFMQCNHEIISLFSDLDGNLEINNTKYVLDNGTGYIEKDFGISFPDKYIWIQANTFQNNNSCIFLSSATIPFGLINFKGLICTLLVNGKEYRFATYNNSKIQEFEIKENSIFVKLKKKDMLLEVLVNKNNENKLIAPINGNMNRKIKESVDSEVKVKLYKNNELVFEDVSKNGGVEIVD